ncbi:unnamed protein product [Boreogadus saida]
MKSLVAMAPPCGHVSHGVVGVTGHMSAPMQVQGDRVALFNHYCVSEMKGPGLWLRSADGGAKTLEDDITLPTRILESGGLTEKPYLWKANPEDDQDSTIKDSSHT